MAISRKRRRLLTASVVAVLLIGGLWWLSRPNLDPRFVGTWLIHNPDGTSTARIYVMRNDGVGWKEDSLGRFQWHTSAGTLVLRQRSGDRIADLLGLCGIGPNVTRIRVHYTPAAVLPVEKPQATDVLPKLDFLDDSGKVAWILYRIGESDLGDFDKP